MTSTNSRWATRTWRVFGAAASAWLCVASLGCTKDSAPEQDACEGEERCACYPNGTCNEGLECLSKFCVDPDGDAGETQSEQHDESVARDITNDPKAAVEGGVKDERDVDSVDESTGGSASATNDEATSDLGANDAGDTESSDSESSDSESSETEPTTSGAPEPSDSESSETEPTDPKDPEPTDSEPTDSEPTDSEPTDSEPTDSEPTETCTPSLDLPMTTTGIVSPACNPYGIEGSWYCYTDEVNPSSCVANEAPYRDGKMCLSGETTEDDVLAWGAGIGLTLNEIPGSSEPRAYDATAHGVIGFELDIEGDLGGTWVRLSYKGESESVAPFHDLPGANHYTVLFEDAEVPDYWEVPTAGDTVDPTAVYELQVQLIGGESNASYDFCISNVRPITGETMTTEAIRGGGLRGVEAANAWQMVGSSALDATPDPDWAVNESAEDVWCLDTNVGMGWCISETALIYCEGGGWLAVNCPTLDTQAYCGYYADEQIVDCVVPAP